MALRTVLFTAAGLAATHLFLVISRSLFAKIFDQCRPQNVLVAATGLCAKGFEAHEQRQLQLHGLHNGPFFPCCLFGPHAVTIRATVVLQMPTSPALTYAEWIKLQQHLRQHRAPPSCHSISMFRHAWTRRFQAGGSKLKSGLTAGAARKPLNSSSREVRSVTEYTLPHGASGEAQRLALMSKLLDEGERARIKGLGLRPGWRCFEVGCGNGSVSEWLAEQVAPDGHAVASDIDTQLVPNLQVPCLEVRRLDVLRDTIDPEAYDLVIARAVLHHLPEPHKALQRMATALKPGGVLLSIEPEMLPCTVATPESAHIFWQGWLRWSRDAGIDYGIGRNIAAMLDSIDIVSDIEGEGGTPVFNGGSDWAQYWSMTIRELAPRLLASRYVSHDLLEDMYRHLSDPHYWTAVITFITTWGRRR